MSEPKRELKETKPPKRSGDRVKLVKEFLEENYEIKINVFDPDKSYIECKIKDMHRLSPTFNDISLHMETVGIRGCDTILKKIIASPNHVTVFNPIVDYVDALKGKWKGESHIDVFCNHIKVREFGDKPEGFYQERLKRLLKKWLAAHIANVYGLHPNDAVLSLLHADEGIGKSTLVESLVPPAMKSYYQKSDKDPRYFDITKAFASNFIVNFDDNVGLTKSNAESIKSTLSSKEFQLNKFLSQTAPRMASGVMTSNKTGEMGGFLLPELGTRRWAIVELDTIDHDYSDKVNIDQLWAEAYVLFETADFNYKWDMNDFNEFADFNMRYMTETNARKLIREFYRVPEAIDTEENITWKQPIEILRELRDARKLTSANGNNVSEVTIGFALKSLNFERSAVRTADGPRYGYKIVQLF